MTATPVAGPTPDAIARFELLLLHMPRIATAVESFADPTVRERAYYELVGLINPSPDEPEPVDVVAVPQWGDAPASAAELGRLASWILDDAPAAWRDSVQPGESTVDATIRFLGEGDQARAALILVRRELVEQGGFTVEQAEGDLIPLIRELAADPPPVAPEIEQLAVYLRGQAEPGETVAEVAIRLIERLRQGRPALVPQPEVAEVAAGLNGGPEQVDDRDGEPEPQPASITAAVDAYKHRTGLK